MDIIDRLDTRLSIACPHPHRNSAHNMHRYPIAIISLLMLIVTFNDPGSNWPVDIRAFDYRLQGNLLYWLFSFSTVSYIPLMIASAILFSVDLVALVKNKTKRNAFNLLFFSAINLLALYRFNNWIFSEIF